MSNPFDDFERDVADVPDPIDEDDNLVCFQISQRVSEHVFEVAEHLLGHLSSLALHSGMQYGVLTRRSDGTSLDYQVDPQGLGMTIKVAYPIDTLRDRVREAEADPLMKQSLMQLYNLTEEDFRRMLGEL